MVSIINCFSMGFFFLSCLCFVYVSLGVLYVFWSVAPHNLFKVKPYSIVLYRFFFSMLWIFVIIIHVSVKLKFYYELVDLLLFFYTLNIKIKIILSKPKEIKTNFHFVTYLFKRKLSLIQIRNEVFCDVFFYYFSLLLKFINNTKNKIKK